MSRLSVLTWNVWFDQLEQRVRYNAICSICQEIQPDVICFQEVIPYFVEVVRNTKYLMDNYTCSDSLMNGKTIEPYGVMTLCKKKFESVQYSFHEFPTIYARKLLVADVVLPNGEHFAVGNVHLESLNNHPTRELQLAISYNVLSKFQHALLCGDFNFCSLNNFNGRGPLENDSLVRLMPNYKDVWVELKQSGVEPNMQSADYCGYTFDTSANPMIGERDERMRYDRVVYRSANVDNNNMNAAIQLGLLFTFKWWVHTQY